MDLSAPSPSTATAARSELALLAAIAQDFISAPAMNVTLSNAIGQIMVYMETEAASIFLLDAAGTALTCVACAGPVAIEGLRLAAGQGIVGQAVASGRVQQVRDVAQDPHFSKSVDELTGFRTRSILCAPLHVKGRMLGALEVINKRSGDGLFDAHDAQLLSALAGMASLAIHNAQMVQALVEQERLQRELELAREIQRSLLPGPAEPGFALHGLNLPALEVSGDFYDFFKRADGLIAWGLGDVSGKGMNAALLMAKTISLFRCLGKTEYDPAQLLGRLNDELVETASRGMFVTMVAGVFDPASGQIVFANAGHQPPLLRRRDGGYAELEQAAPPLGIEAGLDFERQRLPLADGRLYVFSDGVTEGRLSGGGMLGLAGLKTLLDQHADGSCEQQLDAVAAALRGTGARLHDDLTLLVLGQ